MAGQSTIEWTGRSGVDCTSSVWREQGCLGQSHALEKPVMWREFFLSEPLPYIAVSLAAVARGAARYDVCRFCYAALFDRNNVIPTRCWFTAIGATAFKLFEQEFLSRRRYWRDAAPPGARPFLTALSVSTIRLISLAIFAVCARSACAVFYYFFGVQPRFAAAAPSQAFCGSHTALSKRGTGSLPSYLTAPATDVSAPVKSTSVNLEIGKGPVALAHRTVLRPIVASGNVTPVCFPAIFGGCHAF